MFLYDNCYILINIPLEFVPSGPINTTPVLPQIIACDMFDAQQFFEPVIN